MRVGDKHVRTLQEMSLDLLRQSLEISAEFIRRCYEYDSRMRYATINANHLFPAGASLVHPHFQVVVSSVPSTHHDLLLKSSSEYMQSHDSCYFTDLVAKEREVGERWIGQTGSCAWISAFSPLGYNEVQAIMPECQSILDWGEAEPADLARGMEAVLGRYHQMGLSTFNFSLFSGPLGAEHPEFRGFLRLMNRQNVIPHHRTDDYFFQKIMKNELILNIPENLADYMRQEFPGV